MLQNDIIADKVHMSELRTKYPNIAHFLTCWFHQDWLEESSTVEQAIASYIEVSHESEVIATKNEAIELLRYNYDEEKLRNVLRLLGSYYWPGDQSTFKVFLEKIVSTME